MHVICLDWLYFRVVGVRWHVTLVCVCGHFAVVRLGAHSALQLYVNSGLSGTIPSTISSMTALTLLDLSSNALNGTIPTVIGSLTNLMYVLST